YILYLALSKEENFRPVNILKFKPSSYIISHLKYSKIYRFKLSFPHQKFSILLIEIIFTA
ncbi:hypothetical protein, partial [Acinetobacter radioresistens]|uniref:hypothetical protein n=1 Tax=Acinetobacter radioresistens TaxID=40216 RepID=UPI001D0E9FA8